MKPLALTLTTPFHLLVLIGGGEFSFGETSAVDEYLVSKLGANKTIAFLPTASGSAEYATHLGAHFNQLDPEIETINVPIYRGRDNRRQKNLNHILSAGMVYIGGGVANNLLTTLRESPAEQALRDAAAAGAIVAAIGASASAFGANGFAWIDGTVIQPAFDATNDVPLRRLMSVPEVRLGLGIPASTALAVHADGSTEIIGEGSIAVFRKGQA